MNLLLTALVSHDEDRPITADRTGQREANAGITARRLDHCPPRLQLSQLLRAVDHCRADAILDAASRIVGLHLGENQRIQSAREVVDPDQWCSTNKFQYVVVVFHQKSCRETPG